MSNVLQQAEQGCTSVDSPCKAIEQILKPREADLGGFSVRRVLPTVQRKMVGPWIFFDEMGPARFAKGQGINVRPHPHIGLATVTYLFEGEILHRDSLGNEQPIRPGDINLMVAGRGIVHSERERPEVTATEHSLHGLQLWLALPEDKEETEPAFYHIAAADIPDAEIDGVPVRVMIGSAYGVTSPVPVLSDTLYLEAFLQPGQTLELPDAQERGLYVASGKLRAADTVLEPHTLTVFSRETTITVEATEVTRIALIGGQALGKRFINWNFVSSHKERIEQARQDWQAGNFPVVPGDEDEFIPLP